MSWSRPGAAHSPDSLHRVWRTLAAAAAASARRTRQMPAGMVVLRWRGARPPCPGPPAAGTRRLPSGRGVCGLQVTRAPGSVRPRWHGRPAVLMICGVCCKLQLR